MKSVLVLSPHADDEAMGCSGLLAKLGSEGARIHIVYLAVDGFHHWGLDHETSYEERLKEIDRVVELFGDDCSYEIAYGNQDLIEKLDTLPRRDLVDLFEKRINEHRPDLLLVPAGEDYDQDHIAVFGAAFAAARPIGEQFGKWLVPHILTYEMTKIQWARDPLPLRPAYVDITEFMETKLESVRRYETQFRPAPHIRSLDSVKALATIRGTEIGVTYAEAFGVMRTIL
ncbi:MAG: PIG-L deacetylase family protein [Thermoleophilaceae bacterium]